MSGKEIKVTDKRIFTPEGELREEYRFLDEKATATAAAPAPTPETPPPAPASQPAPEPPRPGRSDPRTAAAPAQEPPLDLPGTPPGFGAPTFYDLAAILAEPVALYLGDLEMEGGETAENLEMARMHIDLLDVLRQKTVGNLTAQESAFLEDLLYRLRVRYVQKRG